MQGVWQILHQRCIIQVELVSSILNLAFKIKLQHGTRYTRQALGHQHEVTARAKTSDEPCTLIAVKVFDYKLFYVYDALLFCTG